AAVTAQFRLVLDSQPSADVTVTVSSSHPTFPTRRSSDLTFTAANWNVAQTVTVTGVDDFVDDGDIAYTVHTTAASTDAKYNGLSGADVAVTNRDDDTAGIVVTPTAGLVTTEAGAPPPLRPLPPPPP